jgi:hypothetical protein
MGQCKYCRTKILETASVCHFCGRHQKWWIQNLSNLGYIATILLVFTALLQTWFASQQINLASEQLDEARKAREETSEALERAKKAEARINEARERVEEQSSIVNSAAQNATEAQKLAEKATLQVSISEGHLKLVNADLDRAHKSITELDNLADFMRTLLEAQNDDRRAFDKLRTWANDSTYFMQYKAYVAYQNIVDYPIPSPFKRGW